MDRSPQNSPGPVRRPRVLVAEDNLVNQKVTVKMLERLGLDCAVVNDGAEAVEAAVTERFALILMDCQMPEMDGIEATREIRRRETGIRTPIVALTAGATSGERGKCLEAGMDGYLSKPLDIAQLTEVVRRYATC